MSQLRVDYVESALIALLQAKLPVAYGSPVQIDSLGVRDFDERGVLVLQPPSIRVQFGGVEYKSVRDNSCQTYEAAIQFDVLCFESSLRSKADERAQTLQLVAVVLNQLAGARLTLADDALTPPLRIKGVALVVAEGSTVDQSFGISIEIAGPAQFDGPNAGGN